MNINQQNTKINSAGIAGNMAMNGYIVRNRAIGFPIINSQIHLNNPFTMRRNGFVHLASNAKAGYKKTGQNPLDDHLQLLKLEEMSCKLLKAFLVKASLLDNRLAEDRFCIVREVKDLNETEENSMMILVIGKEIVLCRIGHSDSQLVLKDVYAGAPGCFVQKDRVIAAWEVKAFVNRNFLYKYSKWVSALGQLSRDMSNLKDDMKGLKEHLDILRCIAGKH